MQCCRAGAGLSQGFLAGAELKCEQEPDPASEKKEMI